MGPDDEFASSFGKLSLEPLEGQAASPEAPKAPVKFHANTRSAADRRVLGDRREMYRLDPDRRSGRDRRPKSSWEPGSNL